MLLLTLMLPVQLKWLSILTMLQIQQEALQERLIPFLSEELDIDEEQLQADERLAGLVPLIRERLKVLKGAGEQIDWAFKNADAITYPEPQQLIGKKLDAEGTLRVFEQGLALLETVEPFRAEALERAFRQAAADAELKPGSFFAPFRVANAQLRQMPVLLKMEKIATGRPRRSRRNAGSF